MKVLSNFSNKENVTVCQESVEMVSDEEKEPTTSNEPLPSFGVIYKLPPFKAETLEALAQRRPTTNRTKLRNDIVSALFEDITQHHKIW